MKIFSQVLSPKKPLVTEQENRRLYPYNLTVSFSREEKVLLFDLKRDGTQQISEIWVRPLLNTEILVGPAANKLYILKYTYCFLLCWWQ